MTVDPPSPIQVRGPSTAGPSTSSRNDVRRPSQRQATRVHTERQSTYVTVFACIFRSSSPGQRRSSNYGSRSEHGQAGKKEASASRSSCLVALVGSADQAANVPCSLEQLVDIEG